MILTERDFLHARILIVDDLEPNRVLLEQMLRNAGYVNVSATSEPDTVLALHREHDCDLILLDLQMAAMDGYRMIEILKTNETGDFLPVLVLSTRPEHKLRALQAGARDFIDKPFDLVEAFARIHNLLEVQLLYRKLEHADLALEQSVAERTADLRESEARYRSLIELASDWYWEQDETTRFTRVSGRVPQTLGLQAGGPGSTGPAEQTTGWDETERAALLATIAARKPFLDMTCSRTNPDGSRQRFRISGEPIFSASSRFIGYRGIGAEIPFKS